MHKLSRIHALLSAASILVCSNAFSQTFTAKSIRFEAPSEYSQQELLTFTGMKADSSFTQADVQAAAQKLIDTGLFSDVRFASAGGSLTFTLKAAVPEALMSASYRNFVWWEPTDVSKTVKEKVALFHGVVPIQGNLQQSIVAVLTQMLKEKGVDAVVTVHPMSSPGRPNNLAFEVESPEIKSGTVQLTGIGSGQLQSVQTAVKTVEHVSYDEVDTPTAVMSLVLKTYRDIGYLDAHIDNIAHSAPKTVGDHIEVDLTGQVKEGAPYTVAALNWPGSDTVSIEDFQKFSKLKTGDVASQLALRETLGPLGSRYYAKGYMEAKIQAVPTMDRTAHTVSYAINVVPGDQYRLRDVKLMNATPDQQKEFDAAWKMKPGDYYDEQYTQGFLKKNTSLHSFQGYSATYKRLADPNDHKVEIVITFVKGGLLTQ